MEHGRSSGEQSSKKPDHMARSNQNLIVKGLSGALGKQLVYRQYGAKTVVSTYPNMSNIRHSDLQELEKEKFARAVAYAKAAIRDPEKRKALEKKLKKGQRVFNVAVKEFYEMGGEV